MMTTKRKLEWWLYVCIGIMLLFFSAPALISYADTFAVLTGVFLLAAYGFWSWEMWVRRVIDYFIKTAKEEIK